MLPKLLGPDGSNYLLSGLPFMTSIGRITPLISSSPPDARWKASEPMNGWNVRWSRLTLHLWEWEGRSTLLVVGSSQYQRQEELDRFVEVVRKAIDRVLSGKEGDSCET